MSDELPTIDQAGELLKAGKITQKTFDRLASVDQGKAKGINQSVAEPNASMPDITPVLGPQLAQEYANDPSLSPELRSVANAVATQAPGAPFQHPPVTYGDPHSPNTAAMDNASVNQPAPVTVPPNEGLSNFGTRVQNVASNVVRADSERLAAKDAKPPVVAAPTPDPNTPGSSPADLAQSEGLNPLLVALQRPKKGVPQVEVGKITKVPPAPTVNPDADIEANVSPRGISYFDKKTGLQVDDPVEARKMEGLAADEAKISQDTAEAQRNRDVRLKTEDKLDTQVDKRIGALGNEADARQKQASDTADYYAKLRGELKARDTKNDVQAMNDDAATRNQLHATNLAIDDYASQKVDPARYWKNAGTVGQIGIAVGAFLGVLGKSDKPIEALNSAIDRDIHAQESSINVKGNSVNMRRGVFSDMLNLTKNAEAARQASRAVALQNAELQLKGIAAQYDNPIIAAKAADGIAQLQSQQISARGAVLSTMQKEAQARAAAAYAEKRADAKDEVKFRHEAYLRGMDVDGKRSEKEQERKITIPDNLSSDGKPHTILANSNQDREKMATNIESGSNMLSAMTRQKELIKRVKGGDLGITGSIRDEWNANTAAIELEQRKLADTGVSVSPDEKKAVETISNPGGLDYFISDEHALKNIDNAQQIVKRRVQSSLNTRTEAGSTPAITNDAQAAAVGAVPNE